MEAKFSAADLCYFREPFTAADYYRQLKAIGISAVEMVAPENRPFARAAGLQVLNLAATGMVPGGINRRELHSELLPRLRGIIAEAGAEGIPQVIVFSGNREGQADALGVENCITALRQLLPDAEAANVTLVFEMLCAQDHVNYQADRSAYGFEVVSRLDSPRLRVLYDIYHMQRMGENVLQDLLSNLPLIAHLHLAESPRRTAPVANGEINYQTIVREVHAAGYRGYWGLEFIPGEAVMAEVAQVYQLLQLHARV